MTAAVSWKEPDVKSFVVLLSNLIRIDLLRNSQGKKFWEIGSSVKYDSRLEFVWI